MNQNTTTTAPTRIIKLPEVLNRVASSRASWYAKVSAGKAPRPIKLGVRAVGWLESDINAYVAELASNRG